MLEESIDPDAKKTMNSQVSQKREAYMQAMLELRRLADAANEKYATVAKSAEATEALGAVQRTTKTKLAMGPSRAFTANVKLFEKAEGSVRTEAIELREQGGVFELDVTFNNKVVKSLCLDTGASLISLSSSVAAQIGLKPTKSDPTIIMVADGRNCRPVTIPTVQWASSGARAMRGRARGSWRSPCSHWQLPQELLVPR